MAITLNGSGPDYRGKSTDQKPTDAETNAMFLEMDTGKFYYFDGAAWEEVGGTAP